MKDLYNELLQKSIDRQAKEIISTGSTQQAKYGNLLSATNGRDIQQERESMISSLERGTSIMKKQRDNESREHSIKLQRILNDVRTREKRQAEEYLSEHREYLDRGKEVVQREQSKSYFQIDLASDLKDNYNMVLQKEKTIPTRTKKYEFKKKVFVTLKEKLKTMLTFLIQGMYTMFLQKSKVINRNVLE